MVSYGGQRKWKKKDTFVSIYVKTALIKTIRQSNKKILIDHPMGIGLKGVLAKGNDFLTLRLGKNREMKKSLKERQLNVCNYVICYKDRITLAWMEIVKERQNTYFPHR